MRDNYNRLYELYDFINELRGRTFSGMSYEEIMVHFGWSRKTAERMLNVLKTLFGDGLTYDYIDDGSRRKSYKLVIKDLNKLPLNFISEEDLINLKTASKMLANDANVSGGLSRLAAKLGAINLKTGNNADDVVGATSAVAIPGPKVNIDKGIIGALQEAVQSFKQVEIEYNGRKRVVCPLGFLYGIRNNYLIAANKRYISNPVKYKLCDIASVKILDDFFDAEGFDIHKYSIRSFGVYSGKEDGYDIEWLVKKEAAQDAKNYIFHATQQMIKNEDGTLTIKFHADGLREMAWHLFTWGGMIVPIAPAELVTEYKNYIKLAQESLK